MTPATRPPGSDRGAASPAAGFTLIEVLAAVMIFMLVVTALIGASGALLHRIGETSIQLEAAELADRELARLEAVLASQQKPPADREEDVDDYRIRVWSMPAIDDLGGTGDANAPGGDSALGGLAGGGLLGPMIAMHAPGLDVFLLRYEIRVEWGEEEFTRDIRRTTYAFDWEGARQALPELFAASDAVGEGEIDPDAAGSSEAQELLQQLQGAQ